MKIQNKLILHLKQQGYKVNSVAFACDIEVQRAYRLFKGTVKMTADEFFKICEVYDINMELFEDEKR